MQILKIFVYICMSNKSYISQKSISRVELGILQMFLK